ncbi:MAG: non-ribosomal peptide synthetase, partial [Gammaproteobacteria bacterium]|nr:non-ribosomal peptide synthetase [Gammaproteobacteria bacterium]
QTLYEWTNNTSWLIDMELHGRDQGDIDLSRTIGWFTCFFPVALQWHETEIGALLKSVKEQIRQIPQKGQSYGPLRYLSANHELAELAQADILFNYLGKLPQSTTNLCRTLPDAKNGRVRSLLNKRSHLLEINIVIAKGELIANWSYSHSLYQQSTIEKLATSFMTTLQDIIKHCQLPETGGFTPSDFTDSNLDQNQLDQFIDSIIK